MGNQSCSSICHNTQREIVYQPPAIKDPEKNHSDLTNCTEKKRTRQQQEIVIPSLIKVSIDKYFDRRHQQQGISQYEWIELYNGNYFRGEILNNVPNKFGCFVFPNQHMYYVGDFGHNLLAQGEGLLIFKNNDYYEGQFQKNKANGQGVFKNQQVRIEGTWSEGILIRGKVSALQYEYEGQFVDCRPEGKGIFRKDTKYYYEGTFRKGVYHGKGIENDQHYIYDGGWSEGLKHGYGIIEYRDGSSYKGDWVNNLKEGEGEYTTKTLQKWVGIFKVGRPHQGKWL